MLVRRPEPDATSRSEPGRGGPIPWWPHRRRRARALLVLVVLLAALPPYLLPASAAVPSLPRARSARGATPWPRTLACPPGFRGYRVGAASTNITPHAWPVAEAAYSIGRMAVGAAHPFYARSLAIQACPTGHLAVVTALDSQGYFIAYREDPGAGSQGYGTRAIRLTVAAQTGIPADAMLITATHTHNSPDSIGIWGGSVTADNKGPYLSLVKSQTVISIEGALRSLRRARLFLGSANVSAMLHNISQIDDDPAQYPTDHTLDAVQAVSLTGCQPIATLVRIGIHNDVAGPIAGPHGQLIDPDFFGGVARELSRQLPGDVPVVVPGALGGIGWRFPAGTDPGSSDQLVEVAAYSAVMTRRVDTAITRATSVAFGPVGSVLTRIPEEVANPLVPLFYDEAGTPALHGLMRSIAPRYIVGDVVTAAVQTIRIGPLLLVGSPSEAFPSLQPEVASRVPGADVLATSLAGDQLGYTPPAYEYPVVDEVYGGAAYGQDNGTFTLNGHFGDDVIRANLRAASELGLPANQLYTGLTEGPVVPPSSAGATVPPEREPTELPLRLPCAVAGPPPGRPRALPVAAGPAMSARSALAFTGFDATRFGLLGAAALAAAALASRLRRARGSAGLRPGDRR